MERNLEGRRPVPIEVELGQEIYPFSDKANIRVDYPSVDDTARMKPMYTTDVLLKLPVRGEMKSLTIECNLHYCENDGLGIIPFHPEDGYMTTSEDYGLKSREEKLRRLATLPAIDPIAPQILDIEIESMNLEKAGLVHTDSDGFPHFSQENTLLLKALHCVIEADSLYIARGQIRELIGYYGFDNFFPGSGPLSGHDHDLGPTSYDSLTDKITISEGHPLYFADKEEERKLIGVRFVLDPELNLIIPST